MQHGQIVIVARRAAVGVEAHDRNQLIDLLVRKPDRVEVVTIAVLCQVEIRELHKSSVGVNRTLDLPDEDRAARSVRGNASLQSRGHHRASARQKATDAIALYVLASESDEDRPFKGNVLALVYLVEWLPSVVS